MNGAGGKTILEVFPRRFEWSAVNDVEYAVFISWKCGLSDQKYDGPISVKGLGRGRVLSDGDVDGLVGVDEIQRRQVLCVIGRIGHSRAV